MDRKTKNDFKTEISEDYGDSVFQLSSTTYWIAKLNRDCKSMFNEDRLGSPNEDTMLEIFEKIDDIVINIL